MPEVWVDGDDIEKALVRLKQKLNRDLILREIKTRNSFPKRSCRRKEKIRLALRRKIEEERRGELKKERRRRTRRAILRRMGTDSDSKAM